MDALTELSIRWKAAANALVMMEDASADEFETQVRRVRELRQCIEHKWQEIEYNCSDERQGKHGEQTNAKSTQCAGISGK